MKKGVKGKSGKGSKSSGGRGKTSKSKTTATTSESSTTPIYPPVGLHGIRPGEIYGTPYYEGIPYYEGTYGDGQSVTYYYEKN
jgi:hypothetical protein